MNKTIEDNNFSTSVLFSMCFMLNVELNHDNCRYWSVQNPKRMRQTHTQPRFRVRPYNWRNWWSKRTTQQWTILKVIIGNWYCRSLPCRKWYTLWTPFVAGSLNISFANTGYRQCRTGPPGYPAIAGGPPAVGAQNLLYIF
jgi:hypothetical protein